MQGSYKTCHSCWDMHHCCRRQRWDVEHSEWWSSAHTVLSAAILPAIGDLFHWLPFASFSLMMSANVFKSAAWWRRSATSFPTRVLTPPPLLNWRADNGGIARCASWTMHNVAVQASTSKQQLTSGEKCNGNDFFFPVFLDYLLWLQG